MVFTLLALIHDVGKTLALFPRVSRVLPFLGIGRVVVQMFSQVSVPLGA